MHELNPEAAATFIRDILTDRHRGSISFTKHARKQMALRGYTTQDVIHILGSGMVMDKDLKPNGQLHCRVEGRDLDGDMGIVVTAILDESRLLVITVLGGT
ncbi:MAG: hypothetical protein CVU53_06020 [Deltaproteobacteria bacterium HGW-Deltaproteobacteria-11]|nr:MAG: hypothetical protein CVU53_06020 [Deltaproteobacteria bacterium HGW-Deltaproteobacteria-11]